MPYEDLEYFRTYHRVFRCWMIGYEHGVLGMAGEPIQVASNRTAEIV